MCEDASAIQRVLAGESRAFGVLARNALRGRGRRAAAELSPRPGPAAQPPRPEAGAIREEAFAALDEALALLPPDQRAAFVLAEIEELSYDEIARIEGVPPGTVKSRIARAKVKLRRALRALREGVR